MKHSIFWKIVLILLPVVLLSDIAVLVTSYMLMYENYIKGAENDVKHAADTAADVFSVYDPYNLKDSSNCDDIFTKMCENFSLAYLYAEVPDIENDRSMYVAIGYGKDAVESAKITHYDGYIYHGLSEELVQAFKTKETVYRYADNQYGNVIVCYMPVTGYYDSKTAKIVDKTISVVGAEMNIDSVINTFQTKFSITAIIVSTSTILIIILTAIIIKRFVSKPARLISKRMTAFVSDRESDFSPITFKGKDEFAEMAKSFNIMAEEIDRYIDDISVLNRQKSMQEAEMNIARTIQLGLLEPERFSRDSVNISAQMNAAKDVGGDFYNYQLLKDGRICVVIADVSGKGISSALLMSRALTLLRNYAEAGLTPGEILSRYNNGLAKHNSNTMFITTFIGFFNPETFEFVYSNAGHNYPYLLSDELIELGGTENMAAGIFTDESYDEITVQLKPHDKLFLYTDGVTEASNVKNELFGEDRLKEILKNNLKESDVTVMNTVLREVKRFANGAPQSDDITVLVLMAPDKRRVHLILPAKKESITEVNSKLDALPVDDDTKFQLRLIAEEIFVNICSYAYEDGEGEAVLDILSDEKTVTMIFTDSGREFDPTKDVIDIEEYDRENSIGGLGRFLSFNIADEYSYEYKDGKNILTIVKNIGNEV